MKQPLKSILAAIRVNIAGVLILAASAGVAPNAMAAACLPPSSTAASPRNDLSLGDAWRSMREKNRELQLARRALEAARADLARWQGEAAFMQRYGEFQAAIAAREETVRGAESKVAEARAAGDSAKARFYPWITPSLALRRHDANAQAVNGPVIDADKQSFAAGVALSAQVELGEAHFQELAARQQVRVAEAAATIESVDAIQSRGPVDRKKAMERSVPTSRLTMATGRRPRVSASRPARRMPTSPGIPLAVPRS